MKIQNVRVFFEAAIKTLILAGVLLALLHAWGPSQVLGQEEPETTQTEITETVTVDTTGGYEISVLPESYDFVVQAGDNMSKLTRRAVSLYDQAKPDVELSNEQSMFIETHAVIDMGPRLLDIGEDFSVPTSLIEKYVAQASELSDTQKAAWGVYSDRASYELNDITPTNVPLTDNGDLDTAYTPPTDNSDTEVETPDSNATPAYWWFIGIVAVAILTLLLWPKKSKE